MKESKSLQRFKSYTVLFMVILVVLACVLAFLVSKDVIITIICGIAAIIIGVIFTLIANKTIKKAIRDEKEIKKVKDAISEELEYNAPVPCIVIDSYGKIIWYNNISATLFNRRDLLNKRLTELFPELDLEQITSSEEELLIENFIVEDRIYDIKSESIKKQNRLTLEFDTYHVLYFIDVTERQEAYTKYELSKALFGYCYIDNFEEILNSTEETKRPMMLGVLERKLQTWTKELGGSLKKIEKDKFLFVISKESLNQIVEGKFKILEEVRKISVGNELPITISIGVSLIGENIDTLMEYSKDCAELAMSRGGNQAVVKKDENDYDYFGANSKQEAEGNNNSKAKARIKAYALKELLQSVDNVLIMGHANPDLDAIGSGMGMARVCKELGKNTHIVLSEPNNAIEGLYNKLVDSDDYEEDYFISHEEANRYDKDNTCLIVVDVNSPGHTECPELVGKFDKIAVVDHHIRGAEFIDDAKVIYLDPFASSASEEVIQLAQYMIEKIKFTELEVDAMLAGMLIDTKQFVFKTGVKTFEAAAYLKKNGADNVRVKEFFHNDLDSMKKKADAIKKSEIYRNSTIITVCPSGAISPFTLVPQIADELLNITGIEASFVVYDTGEGSCTVSARSNGNVNVQIIMEDLGGGGHFIAAGVQIKDKTPKDIIEDIKHCIDTYFEESGQGE